MKVIAFDPFLSEKRALDRRSELTPGRAQIITRSADDGRQH
jgi:hypothetical protein